MAKEIGASSCKRSTRRILKIFFLNFWIITLSSQANGKVTDICYGGPKEDRRLESNATISLKLVHVNFAIECILECAQDKTRSCRSVNYKIYSNSEGELNCELLKVEEQEENLKKNESYEYYIVQNNRKVADHFQSNPKPSATEKTLETGKTCRKHTFGQIAKVFLQALLSTWRQISIVKPGLHHCN
ncbi:uncharacterized protein LOC114515549 [Dendronephthya gigantea]|uniref:uncharacterized protein LOC114515549 n=1 Tax=Dendronephthya gigantea TaxID=151771 RepID=UPI00106BFA67|nr:uncharacterized protein LOC114515549 [Dendronephthya gigantea]